MKTYRLLEPPSDLSITGISEAGDVARFRELAADADQRLTGANHSPENPLLRPLGGHGKRPQGVLNLADLVIYWIVKRTHPCTPRGTFYQAHCVGLVSKEEPMVGFVDRRLVIMRAHGIIPDPWIIDETREVNITNMWDNPGEYIDCIKDAYCVNPWSMQKERVVIVVEKRALGGVFSPATKKWRVPLVLIGGYSSRSYLANDVAQYVNENTHVIAFGDFDASGCDISRDTEKRMRDILGIDFDFVRAAVNEEQIEKYHLPTAPQKQSDSRAGKHGKIAVQLDSMNANTLREMVSGHVHRYLDLEAWNEALEEEEEVTGRISNVIEAHRHEMEEGQS